MSTRRRDPRDWAVQRRLRGLLLRGSTAATPAAVVARLTAMQAQEHRYARWSVAQRASGVATAAAVDAAFDDGLLLRTHVLRPTWHYATPADLRWLIGLSGPRLIAGNARRYAELGLDARTLGRSTDLIAEAVAPGPRTRRELAALIDERGLSAGGGRLAHMLMHAELTGVVCSGPMRGRQHTYAAFDQRVPGGNGPAGDAALAELAWRYFSTRGPATVRDFAWWSGLTAPAARRGLDAARPRLVSRELGGQAHWLADPDAPPPAQARIDLVQCYDEMIVSYSQSRDLLQGAGPAFPLLRRQDGFVHVMLADGRPVGYWRADADPARPRITLRTASEPGEPSRRALAAAVGRYRRFTQAEVPVSAG